MTGEDHNTNAIVAALRSPALPAEQVGEAAAVTAMTEARETAFPATPSKPRSRRGIAIAAVTVASLGVGGLVAAGPGIFSPAADRPQLEPVVSVATDDSEVQGETDDEVPGTPSLEDVDAGIELITTDDDVDCAEGNHGKTVSSVARATAGDANRGELVSRAAQSDCGKPGPADAGGAPAPSEVGGAVECADGNHGKTVSSVAPATESGPGKGAIVSEAARSDCGKAGTTDEDESATESSETPDPGKSADNGQPENPGKSADNGQPENPGKSADNGQPENPGKSADKSKP